MEISNELLAAYAEGKVTKDERLAVRQYLAEHPEELESVMIMMDDDFDLTLDDEDENVELGLSDTVMMADSISNLQYSSAAFAPKREGSPHMAISVSSKGHAGFSKRLSSLMDELDL